MLRRAGIRGEPLLGLGFVMLGLAVFGARTGILAARDERVGLLIVGGLGLLTAVWRLSPAWLVSATVASTTLAGNWYELGFGQNASPNRLILIGALVCVMLRVFRERNSLIGLNLGWRHFLLLLAVVYAVVSGVAVGTIGGHYAIYDLLDQYGVIPFVTFTLGPVVFRTAHERNILLGTLTGTGFYLGVTAVFEKLKVTALILPSYIADPSVGIHYGRARGPFVDAGADGIALFLCGAAAAVAWRLWQGERARRFAAVTVPLCAIGVLLTETRGDWICAGAGLLVVMVFTAKLRRYLLPVACGTVALVLTAIVAVPGLSASIDQRLNDKNPVYERQNTTAAAIRELEARPLLGFGWEEHNNHLVDYFRVSPTRPLTGAAAGIHNLYLEYGTALGLLGLGLWGLALACCFGPLLAVRGMPLSEWRVGFRAMLVAWAVVGLFAPATYAFSTLLLWTVAGVISAANPPRRAVRGG